MTTGPGPGRAFVTGASGFVGAAVAAKLRAQGWQVSGIDRAANAQQGVSVGDVLVTDMWRELVRGCDVVIHTAAVVSNAVGAPEQWRVNVLGTRNVVQIAAEVGAKRVVHLSSVRAFSDTGFPPGVSEEHPVRPDGNPYVDTKIASEHVVLAAHAAREIQAVVVRPADIYGPRSEPWVVKPLQLAARRQFLLPAMGRGTFSPVYIDDLVEGVLLAATVPAAGGQIFTIGGPQDVTTAEYFGELFRIAGRGRPVAVPTSVAVGLAWLLDSAQRAQGRRGEANPATVRYLARRGGYSSQKARRILGYRPLVDLETGMRQTEGWLRQLEAGHQR